MRIAAVLPFIKRMNIARRQHDGKDEFDARESKMWRWIMSVS